MCVCMRLLYVSMFLFFLRKRSLSSGEHGNVSVGVSHCVGCVLMCGYMFVHANVCALSVQTAFFTLQGVVLREIN